MQQSKIRGLHAFGLGWAVGKGVKVEKSNSFDRLLSLLPAKLPARIVFHARYSTSGDYTVMANNQPLERDGACLAFNGTLDMGTKEEMERRHGVKLLSDNDGELALLAALRGKLGEFVAQTRGSFAGILVAQNTLSAVRNSRRPLWMWEDGKGGTFFASTRDIFKRADIGAEPVEVPAGQILTL
jgi:glutamine phosphoribosylpyrophosphate amidotransferase